MLKRTRSIAGATLGVVDKTGGSGSNETGARRECQNGRLAFRMGRKIRLGSSGKGEHLTVIVCLAGGFSSLSRGSIQL